MVSRNDSSNCCSLTCDSIRRCAHATKQWFKTCCKRKPTKEELSKKNDEVQPYNDNRSHTSILNEDDTEKISSSIIDIIIEDDNSSGEIEKLIKAKPNSPPNRYGSISSDNPKALPPASVPINSPSSNKPESISSDKPKALPAAAVPINSQPSNKPESISSDKPKALPAAVVPINQFAFKNKDSELYNSFDALLPRCRVCDKKNIKILGFLCDHNVCEDCSVLNGAQKIAQFLETYSQRPEAYDHFSYTCPVDGCFKKISLPTVLIIVKMRSWLKHEDFRQRNKMYIFFEDQKINEWIPYLDGLVYNH